MSFCLLLLLLLLWVAAKGCERQQKCVIFRGGANLAVAALDKDSDWQTFPRRADQSRQSDGMNATSNSRLETRSPSLALMSHHIAHIRSQSQYSRARGADNTRYCAEQIQAILSPHPTLPTKHTLSSR